MDNHKIDQLAPSPVYLNLFSRDESQMSEVDFFVPTGGDKDCCLTTSVSRLILRSERKQ